MFHIYVAIVSSGRCKSRSGCYICCYAYTRIFQVFYLFQTYVANILSRCFKSRSGCCTLRPVSVTTVGQPTWVCCAGRGVGARTQVLRWTLVLGRGADVGAAQVWDPRLDVTSRPDVRKLGLPNVYQFALPFNSNPNSVYH